MILGCVCLMLLACQGEPKLPTSSSQEQLSRIDSLQTDTQVIRLVEGYAEHYRPFTLYQPDTALCRGVKSCVDCRAVRSWMKADFDGNGRTDVLVFGEKPFIVGTEKALICLLDSGKALPHPMGIGKYSEWHLGFDNFAEGMLPWIIEQKPKDLIAFARKVYDSEDTAGNYRCIVDTLILDKGRFIEYNPAPGRYSVKSIQFETTHCYGSCPVFKMTIDYKGKASYEALEYNRLSGRFTGLIDKDDLQELWYIVNYLKFRQMGGRYEVGETDHQTAVLTVTYEDGTADYRP